MFIYPEFPGWLLARDRGKFVRTREDYLRLASAHFVKVETHLRHDLLRLPYTHLTMRCFNRVPAADEPGHSTPDL